LPNKTNQSVNQPIHYLIQAIGVISAQHSVEDDEQQQAAIVRLHAAQYNANCAKAKRQIRWSHTPQALYQTISVYIPYTRE